MNISLLYGFGKKVYDRIGNSRKMSLRVTLSIVHCSPSFRSSFYHSVRMSSYQRTANDACRNVNQLVKFNVQESNEICTLHRYSHISYIQVYIYLQWVDRNNCSTFDRNEFYANERECVNDDMPEYFALTFFTVVHETRVKTIRSIARSAIFCCCWQLQIEYDFCS